MKICILAALLGIALASSTGNAYASGTVSQPQRMMKPGSAKSDDAYARGKNAYMEKLACSTCPVSGGVQDKAGADALVARMQAGEFALSGAEKRRIKAYLENRFPANQ